jgi:hypothetical protein
VSRPTQPVVCIICAPLPPTGAASMASPLGHLVSWYGPLSALESAGPLTPPAAIEIDSLAAASRRRLRELLQASRQSCPTIEAAIVTGDTPPPHRDLLADEGIRVVLTSQFSRTGRPRRPAPAGWSCCTMQWGLWEVLREARPRHNWLTGRGLPSLRPGTLAAIDVATWSQHQPHRQLIQTLSRLERPLATNRAVIARLPEIPDLVTGRECRNRPDSILRAA